MNNDRITTIIIDDSRLARSELQRLLDEIPEVEVLGEANDADQAQALIEAQRPDCILLDIDMPRRNGFELLESLNYVPQVIFTTAYDEYAAKAFEVNALDYLQKPIRAERLRAALKRISKSATPQSKDNPLTTEDQVFVREGEQCWFIKLGEIKLFEVSGNYTRIHFKEARPTIQKTLQSLEDTLDPKTFFRANRQQIVNLRWIESIEPWFNGTLKTILKDGTEVEISRRQAARFKEILTL